MHSLHHKLFKCTVCTLNYDIYYTLHPTVSFTVIFDGTLVHMTRTCVLLRWKQVKRQKHPSSQSIKTKFFSFYFFLALTSTSTSKTLPKSKPCNPKPKSEISNLAF